jgi:hypothetical protein
MKRANTVAIEIQSAFTKRPLVVFFSGLTRKSSNRKTGPMVQVHILDVEADLRIGPSASMCGGCPRRGGVPSLEALRKRMKLKRCYVEFSRAPHSIVKAFRKGNIPIVSLDVLLSRLPINRPIRWGASGDPCNIPIHIVRTVSLSGRSGGWTGYTRGWRSDRFAEYRAFFMASVDGNPDDLQKARERGWRCFNIRPDVLLSPDSGEQCPAAAEAGHLVRCIDCQLCGGTYRQLSTVLSGRDRDVSIREH